MVCFAEHISSNFLKTVLFPEWCALSFQTYNGTIYTILLGEYFKYFSCKTDSKDLTSLHTRTGKRSLRKYNASKEPPYSLHSIQSTTKHFAKEKKTADSAVEKVRSTVNKLSNCKHMEQERCEVSETELYLCGFKKIFFEGTSSSSWYILKLVLNLMSPHFDPNSRKDLLEFGIYCNLSTNSC